MTYKQTQCLIFSKAYRKYADREQLHLRFAGIRPSTPSVLPKRTVKAVALLPRDFCNEHQTVLDHFSKNDVHIARNGDELHIELNNQKSLFIFECGIDENLEEEVDSFSMILTPKVYLFDRKDLELMFDKTKLKIRMEDASCTNALTRPAIDDQNTEVFKHLLEWDFQFKPKNSYRITRECIPRKSSGGVPPWINPSIPLLSVASSYGLDLLVQALLDHGADVNAKQRIVSEWNPLSSLTPLLFAAREGNATTAKLLLERGALVNSGDEDGVTPLYIAAEQCFFDLAEVLLQYGADVNACICGLTPLHLAVTGEKYFLKHLKWLTEWTRVDEARGLRNPEIFSAQTPLQLLEDLNTAKEQKWSSESTLHAEDADATNERAFTSPSSDLGEIEWLEHMLRYDPRLHGRESKSLQSTVINRRRDLTRLLLDYGADVNSLDDYDGRTPLHFAVAKNRSENAKVRAAVNESNRFGRTPLNINKNLEVAKILLENNADTNCEDNENRTPLLSEIVHAEDLDVLKMLLDFGARIKFKYDSNLGLSINGTYVSDEYGMDKHVLEYVLSRCFVHVDFENSNESPKRFQCKDLASVFARHLVRIMSLKLQDGYGFDAADFWVWMRGNQRRMRRNQRQMRGNQRRSLSAFQKKCEKEVIQMKSQLIAGTDVSFFELLAKDEHQVARLFRNQSVSLDTDELKTMFPEYGLMLTCSVENGRNRLAWHEQGIVSCKLLSANFKRMPDEIKENIVSRLSIADIRSVKKACAAPS